MKQACPLDSAILRAAAADFRYLLARDYPRAAALALVGNRYNLTRMSRQLLHRGVFAPTIAADRRTRLHQLKDVAGRPLGIDGHNVLITLECALQNLPLVAADDGFLRDVGQVSRSFKPSPATDRVLALLLDYLIEQAWAGPVAVFYDAPMSLSGELARRTAGLAAARSLNLTAAAVPVPEHELQVFPGPIATSDTALIDAHDPVVDLAGEIIRQNLKAEIITLL
ncbi:MAG: DUF434 domain-containing protein [Deltaproteobacteria bacterium]|nr:DUF434 domain-containing protein [Deltaproteobacteria bacterium]